MNYGIYTSGLGAVGQSVRMDVIANNLANVDTPAFRRETVTFRERLVEAREDRADMKYYNSMVDRHGGAPFIDTISEYPHPGGFQQTGRSLDMSIEGEGYFMLRQGGTSDTFFTRAGNFTFNSQGTLVTADGKYEVLDTGEQAIRKDPTGSNEIVVGPDGRVFQKDGSNVTPLGTLGIRAFHDATKLQKQGNNVYADLGAGEKELGSYRINQAFLETSSSNPLVEMVEMIQAVRTLESNLQMIRLQDTSLDRLVNDFARLRG